MLMLLAGIALAVIATTPSTKEGYSTVFLVRAIDEIKVPATRDGLLKELHVDRGAELEEGSVIAEIDTLDTALRCAAAEAELERARLSAESVGRVRLAEVMHSIAQTEHQLFEELGPDAIHLERERARHSLEKSRWELILAENEQLINKQMFRVRETELALARSEVTVRKIFSPSRSVVKQLHAHAGEWVTQGEPIATIVRLDRLVLEFFVDVEEIGPHEILGRRCSARIMLSNETVHELQGLTVTRTSPSVELDGKYLVFIEFDNTKNLSDGTKATISTTDEKRGDGPSMPWLIRPGMRGEITIALEEKSNRLQSVKP
jgi:hypothetical protein